MMLPSVPPCLPPSLPNGPRLVARVGDSMNGYFFRSVDAAPELDAFCNWGGMSLEHASDLAFPGGMDLLAQLEGYRPEIVIGDGTHLFVISRQPHIIESVRALDQA